MAVVRTILTVLFFVIGAIIVILAATLTFNIINFILLYFKGK